jgi:hypothetical protein
MFINLTKTIGKMYNSSTLWDQIMLFSTLQQLNSFIGLEKYYDEVKN